MWEKAKDMRNRNVTRIYYRSEWKTYHFDVNHIYRDEIEKIIKSKNWDFLYATYVKLNNPKEKTKKNAFSLDF
jgi:hypothetical protein